MANSITLAIDAMGGDHGPASSLPGLAIIADAYKDVRFEIFGDETQIKSYLVKYPRLDSLSRVYHTIHGIKGSDKPSAALRSSRDTSMRLAIEAVAEGRADAIVSSGNTGALMALAKMILKTSPGIHRPAIASIFPTMGEDTIMLDLGANVLVNSENLAQFAVLGAVFARVHKNKSAPTVGLLNVGSEDTKGPEHVREAGEILSVVSFPGKYIGFVEGNDITNGSVDVVVSDGYAGNIALKTAEGVGKLAGYKFKSCLNSGWLSRIGAIFAYFALKRLKTSLDPRLYNGGVFLGLGGLCVKSHGGTDEVGFASAVRLAIELTRHGYVKQVEADIADLMSQESFLSREVI